MGGGASVSDELIAYLEANQGSAKYLVAATGSQTTAPIIIQTGKAVVTIGGFSGGDTAPTVAQLEQMVAAGELKYVLLSGAQRRAAVAAGRHRPGCSEHGHRRRRLREPYTVAGVTRRGGATCSVPPTCSITWLIGVRDLAASRAFYEAALAPLGFAVVMEFETRVAFGPPARPIFLVVEREPTAGIHLAFQADDRDRVDAFHAAALAAGGRTTAGPASGPTTTRTTTARSSSTRTATTPKPSATRRR